MSFHAIQWALGLDQIDPVDRLVLVFLCDFHNGKTGQCNPGMDLLQEKTGLQARALQRRMKSLEAENLIEREYNFPGRGGGSKVSQYNLKFDVERDADDDELDAHDETHPMDLEPSFETGLKPLDPSPETHLKIKTRHLRSLDASFETGLFKEEPGKNQEHSVCFDDAWNLYRSCTMKVRQTKKTAKDQWAKAVKKVDPEIIMSAIKCEVESRKNPSGFVSKLPDMHRWLREERWQDVEAPPTPEKPNSQIDWQKISADYLRLGIWPHTLGAKPVTLACEAPEEILRVMGKQAVAQGDGHLVHRKWWVSDD